MSEMKSMKKFIGSSMTKFMMGSSIDKSIKTIVKTIVNEGQPLRTDLVNVIRRHWQSDDKKLNAWIATSPKELVSWFNKLWSVVWNCYRRMLDVKKKVDDYNSKNPKKQTWPNACNQVRNIYIWATKKKYREEALDDKKMPNPDIGFKLGVEWCNKIAKSELNDYSIVIDGALHTCCKKLLELSWWKNLVKELNNLKDLKQIESWLGYAAAPDRLFDANEQDAD